MTKPTPKKRGNPTPPILKPGKGSVKGRHRTVSFPKYLEDFCQYIFDGHTVRESAALIGRAPASGPYYFNLPDVKVRLAQIEKQYQDLRLEKRVEEATLREQFIDDQIMDMAVNGEGKKKRGRLRACDIGYRKLRLIDPPSAQTIIALNMTKGGVQGQTLNAPKLYEAQRFLKLKQGDVAITEAKDA